MVKFKDIILTEIGETTDAFRWQMSYDSETERVYEFSTPENEYQVFVKPFTLDWLSLDFETKDGGENTVTNEGEHFRVMATVIEIARHAWKRRSALSGGDRVKGYSFYTGDSRRLRLYARFIRTQWPNANVEKAGSGRINIKIV